MLSTKETYYNLRQAVRGIRSGRVYFATDIYCIAQTDAGTFRLFSSVESSLTQPEKLYPLRTRLIRYKHTGQLVPKRWRL